MQRKIREIIVWGLLVAVGVGLRLWLEHIPNFAPVAGLALFAGYFFRNRITAISAPLAVMLLTDLQFGGYHPLIMAAVYGGLALPVIFAVPLRRRLALDGPLKSTAGSVLGLLGCTAASAILFFLVTNLACWTTGMYSMTVAGLAECYWQALPFFRYTFLGDVVFASLFFGAYAVAKAWAGSRQSVLATA